MTIEGQNPDQQTASQKTGDLFTLHWANSSIEIEEVQRLRYKIFSDELGVTLHGQNGLDIDQFDNVSKHLFVRHEQSGEVLGTYRLITADVASQLGWYTEQEFNIDSVKNSGLRLLEVGRACVHPDYRSGMVVLMLWKAILNFAKDNQIDLIMGCTSVNNTSNCPAIQDVQRLLHEQDKYSQQFQVIPLHPFTNEMQVNVHPEVKIALPPLLKGYLRLGGKFCGEPAWDPDFHCADFFTYLSMNNLSPKYARHFGLE